MIKIKLNDSEYEIESYSRTTSITDNMISSSAYFNILNGDNNELDALVGTKISSIEIAVDGDKIYDLKNIDAEINSINEFLSIDRMNYNVNLTFNQGDTE